MLGNPQDSGTSMLEEGRHWGERMGGRCLVKVTAASVHSDWSPLRLHPKLNSEANDVSIIIAHGEEVMCMFLT